MHGVKFHQTFAILISAVPGSISISSFASLIGIFIGISSSAVGLKNFEITAEFKKYKSIINKKRKNTFQIFNY